MIFIPFHVDVPMARWPIANWALMLVTILVSIVAFPATMLGEAPYERWMLSGAGDWSADAGLLGSMLTHADFMHLAGNMVFLFVFGNAVNAKLGHGLFIASYCFLGVVSALVFGATSDGPALGASGAISGVTGLFIALYPKNNVTVWYWLYRSMGTFQVSAWVVIGFYFAKDLIFQILFSAGGYDSGVALMAHLGGTLAGVTLGVALLATRRLAPTRYEHTLLEALGIQR